MPINRLKEFKELIIMNIVKEIINQLENQLISIGFRNESPIEELKLYVSPKHQTFLMIDVNEKNIKFIDTSHMTDEKSVVSVVFNIQNDLDDQNFNEIFIQKIQEDEIPIIAESFADHYINLVMAAEEN